MTRFALLFAGMSFVGLVACASSATPNAPVASNAQLTSAAADAHPGAAKVWRTRCGQCHVRVEPGTRDRGHLETALKRHRTRVKMDEATWVDMVDFLAAEPPSTSASAAPPPPAP